MTLDEMRSLTDFLDGYKKLCEETGVYLIANTDGCVKPEFISETYSELKIDFMSELGVITTELVKK